MKPIFPNKRLRERLFIFGGFALMILFSIDSSCRRNGVSVTEYYSRQRVFGSSLFDKKGDAQKKAPDKAAQDSAAAAQPVPPSKE